MERFRSFPALEPRRNAVVERSALQHGADGCALGSLASELSDQDDKVRRTLWTHLAGWSALLAAGFRRMQDAGSLSMDTGSHTLSVGVMAAQHGGYYSPTRPMASLRWRQPWTWPWTTSAPS
jgi:hypothetical protein